MSRLIRLLLPAFAALGLLRAQESPAGAALPPRLVVLCSVDQLASWVYQQAEPHFAADGGFRRLRQQGAWFPQCAYTHACTETGPGHATIGTGAPARVHGIGRNDWWSEADGKVVYCAEQPAEPFALWPEGKNRGPGRLLVPTFAASLKAHVPGAKVVSVAWKDRSAILAVGAAADAVAWMETATGNLVSNTQWGTEPPPWLVQFHRERAIDRWFGARWERTGPDAAYEGLVDDRPYETPHGGGTRSRTLPQVLDGGAPALSPAFYSQIYASPFGNTLVRLAAEAAVRGADLGSDAATDLLSLSFSSTDVIGHTFGPESVEARDALLRLDRELALLFACFDERVGAGRWAVFLTADHGVAPTPEWAAARGVDAGRGLIQTMVRAAGEKALQDRFGVLPPPQRYLAYVGDGSCFLSAAALASQAGARRLDDVRREAAALVAAAAVKVRGVAQAIPTEELLAPSAIVDPLRAALVAALPAGRGGDVQLVLKPYWVDGTTPATHGSPHAYDREVVAFAAGPGVPAGATFAAAITPGFGAVLFARMLGIPPPSGAIDTIPAGLFGWR
ncbi:MAG: alkaline phosphatase family protein [Planctomycetes bacterium]|jgi:predicted AlkP superfamily pyrophosphatase or phosphodiesterase|nr:alkaline phosphatase family protein [Planctomycetota bacterium]